MQIEFSKKFAKLYKKLPKKIRVSFNERLILLLEQPHHPLLNIHELQGDMHPLQSMNVTGDYRALFIMNTDEQLITFYIIGTHSDLY